MFNGMSGHIWELRVLEERARDLIEWRLVAEDQLRSQLARVDAALARQRCANSELAAHLRALDDELRELSRFRAAAAP